MNGKLNQSWVDQGIQFHNKLMPEWIDNNNILMYSTLNEANSVTAKSL